MPVVIALVGGSVAQVFSDRPLRVVVVDRLRHDDDVAVAIPLPDGDVDHCQVLPGADMVTISREFSAAYLTAGPL